MRYALLAAALALAGCGSTADKAAEKKAPPPAPVKDNTARLLPLNRTAARIVPDHILGKAAMPGGTLGEYQLDGTNYQLFIIETDSPQDAAILLLDLKATLRDPVFIPTMGGYSGTDSGKLVYSFAKGRFLAGVDGLPEDQADPIARQLAARLY